MGCTQSQVDHDANTFPKPSSDKSSLMQADSAKVAAGSLHAVSSDRGDAIRSAFLSGQLTIDSRCPLNERQLYCITKSWKAINRNMSEAAINTFVRLFETNRDIQQMFSVFKDVDTVAELRTSKVLESHAMKVFQTIDDTIVNFDDMDYVLKMLQIVAQSHSDRFPHFNPEFFARVEEPFILAVKDELGDRFTISMETIYRVTIRFIAATLIREFISSREMATRNGHQTPPRDSTDGEARTKPTEAVANGETDA